MSTTPDPIVDPTAAIFEREAEAAEAAAKEAAKEAKAADKAADKE